MYSAHISYQDARHTQIFQFRSKDKTPSAIPQNIVLQIFLLVFFSFVHSIYSRLQHYQLGLDDLAPAFPSHVCRSYYLTHSSFFSNNHAWSCLMKSHPPKQNISEGLLHLSGNYFTAPVVLLNMFGTNHFFHVFILIVPPPSIRERIQYAISSSSHSGYLTCRGIITIT